MSTIRYLHRGILLLVLISACAQAPVEKEVSPEEIVRRHRVLGNELAQKLESRLEIRRDSSVSEYLQEIAKRLVTSIQNPDGSPDIWLIRNQNSKWRSYALPGNRVYLPVGLLRVLEYENEVAAALALQFGHVVGKHVLDRIAKVVDPGKSSNQDFDGLLPTQPSEFMQNVECFGTNSVFNFSEEAELSAVQEAVHILYGAGYDPRGVISLLSRYQEHQQHSPYEMSTVIKLMDQARREIALFAPLRNPIVRTQGFLTIQQRIRKL